MHPVDTLRRPVRDLRISVTDRCNFRCTYCMPKTVFGQEYRFMDRKELLTFEELERVVRVFAELGVEKIRLTGGEPLLRKELEALVERLDTIDGLDLTLTTNASLLARKAEALRATGKSTSFIARKVSSSSESRLTVIRSSPAAASAAALPARSDAFVVRVSSPRWAPSSP